MENRGIKKKDKIRKKNQKKLQHFIFFGKRPKNPKKILIKTILLLQLKEKERKKKLQEKGKENKLLVLEFKKQKKLKKRKKQSLFVF